MRTTDRLSGFIVQSVGLYINWYKYIEKTNNMAFSVQNNTPLDFTFIIKETSMLYFVWSLVKYYTSVQIKGMATAGLELETFQFINKCFTDKVKGLSH